ncbi:hypothetical protein RAL09_004283 [Vibrio vulnificus]|nr:hypothetical protein [Vibrio vulnificus]
MKIFSTKNINLGISTLYFLTAITIGIFLGFWGAHTVERNQLNSFDMVSVSFTFLGGASGIIALIFAMFVYSQWRWQRTNDYIYDLHIQMLANIQQLSIYTKFFITQKFDVIGGGKDNISSVKERYNDSLIQIDIITNKIKAITDGSQNHLSSVDDFFAICNLAGMISINSLKNENLYQLKIDNSNYNVLEKIKNLIPNSKIEKYTENLFYLSLYINVTPETQSQVFYQMKILVVKAMSESVEEHKKISSEKIRGELKNI